MTQAQQFDLLLIFGVSNMEETNYTSKSLDHLGLVAGFCQEVGIAAHIDTYFPQQSSQKHLTYGQCVEAMLLNGLGFVGRTLHMYPQYFDSKPVERLLGAGITAENINDDVLGRCLDKLYEVGVSDLYQMLAEKVIVHLGLPCDSVHLDSSSFHVDGEYESEDDFQGVRLVRGYSRDHRPELNQVILNLITENQAGLPVYMQACSGNSNDSETFKQLVKSHIGSLKAAQRSRYFVGDASLYVAQTIQSLDQQKQLFVTRVPQKLLEAKSHIQHAASYDFTPMENGYSGTWLSSDYGGVKQKWLLIRSEQASYREQKTLEKQALKSSEASIRQFNKLCREEFSCKEDAMNQLQTWAAKQKYVDIANVHVTDSIKHAKRGRPSKESPGKTVYLITGNIYICLDKYSQLAQEKGLFILATNDCSGKLDMETLLAHYKSQQSVERGFRFLKSPDFLTSSFYLKKPERIEALLMVMTCCLMVYAALEHLTRNKLREHNQSIPNMKQKPTQKPTARWIFYCFQGVEELSVDGKQIIINLKASHRTILDCLGACYRQIYS